MGQISLPRLEKINTAMHWESGLLFKQEHWAAPKLFILNKLLIRYFFKTTFFKKKLIWRTHKHRYFLKSFFYSRTLAILKKQKTKPKTFDFLDSYIYCWDNTYYTLVLYSSKKKSKKKIICYKQVPLLIIITEVSVAIITLRQINYIGYY